MAVGVAKDSPAEKAGIKRGDKILSVDGRHFTTEDQLVAYTKAHAGQRVVLRLEHDGKVRETKVQLRSPDSKDGYLGVTPLQTYKQKYGFVDAVITAGGLTLQLMWATLAAFGGLIAGLFAHGQVSDQVAGPVGIVVLLNSVVELGAAYVLIFVASISISLAVVNALPLPALDGGRWLLSLVQRVTRRQLSEQTEGLVHAAGFLALILLMVVVTFFDIKRLG
jgi:regulator of sigma E protease